MLEGTSHTQHIGRAESRRRSTVGDMARSFGRALAIAIALVGLVALPASAGDSASGAITCSANDHATWTYSYENARHEMGPYEAVYYFSSYKHRYGTSWPTSSGTLGWTVSSTNSSQFTGGAYCS